MNGLLEYPGHPDTHLTLGEMINILKQVDPGRVVTGYNNPHSYRGDYACLAFETGYVTTVGNMLALAEESDEMTYTGWKGGEYTMTETTKVYIAREGTTGVPLTFRRLMETVRNK